MSTPYDRSHLDALLTGRTADIAVPTGTAYFFYGADGSAAVSLPDGTRRKGHWKLNDDCYEAQWPGLPPGRTQVLPGADGWEMRDAATGEPRGRVIALRPGNPQGL
ncbi:hypothetical protein [Pararhodobacter sp.]|uniref:hypothetical protein n=1 Tax=Pararhodobacter sp. TaxID=2127056 RepID=UPI002AFF9F4C|nr:hypothetical protein [Pararhodobacter sp.]